MLDLRISLDDHDAPRVSTDDGLCFGGSRVSPFRSPLLSFGWTETGDATEIWIGECQDPFRNGKSLDSRLSDCSAFDIAEGISVALHRKDDRPLVELARTRTGGCPIYLAAGNGRLVASWKFDEVALSIDARRPNLEACRRFLKYGPRPVRDQIVDGMVMLWPGERATFGHDGLSFEEMEPPQIALPGALADDARATDAFIDLLAATLEPVLACAARPLVEVSGGYDSSCVALAAARVRSDLASYAVVHDGVIGAQQRRRREELVQLLGLKDFVGPSSTPGPFASLATDECSLTPMDDAYRLACIRAVEAHPTGTFDLALTGIGGDEITKENTFRREDWEVRGSISSSAADASAGRSDMFMRRGIWLSQPFTNPTVVNFCRALPRQLRTGRMLNILALARAGLSDGFIFPRYCEHYGNVIKQEATHVDFDAALSESIVADYGIAEISSVLARAREATRDGLPLDLIVELWLVMKLEVVLRRYLA